MFNKQLKSRKAFTLIEAMVAASILCIVAVGALQFQYFTARDAKFARAQITATRTGQLLLEDWMSTGGSDDYNPAKLELGFVTLDSSPTELNKYSTLGKRLRDTVFSVEIDGRTMITMLVSKDIEYDEAAKVTLRQLSVYVSYGVVVNRDSIETAEAFRPVILTTYIRVDAGGG